MRTAAVLACRGRWAIIPPHMAGTEIIRVSDDQQVFAAAAGAAAVQEGRLVGFATETVYGIAALATDEQAMRRL